MVCVWDGVVPPARELIRMDPRYPEVLWPPTESLERLRPHIWMLYTIYSSSEVRGVGPTGRYWIFLGVEFHVLAEHLLPLRDDGGKHLHFQNGGVPDT